MNAVEERRARWQQICREYRDSVMTRDEFCEARGTARSTWATGSIRRGARHPVLEITNSAGPIWFRLPRLRSARGRCYDCGSLIIWWPR